MQNEEICRCLNKSFLAVSYIVDKVGGGVFVCVERYQCPYMSGALEWKSLQFFHPYFFFFFF